jgi:hypothetical protein
MNSGAHTNPRIRHSRRAANARPVLSEREMQSCAKCHRTRYEHESLGLITDHDFAEPAAPKLALSAYPDVYPD